MNGTVRKPLVIYHANCTDGFTAAWCFWTVYGDDAEYYAGTYGKVPPDCSDRDVFLVDFSYSRGIVGEMIKVAKSVTLIDHHKTALENLRNLDGLNYFTDINRSGAGLAWDYLNRNNYVQRPPLVNFVEDYDLWKFSLFNTRKIHAALSSYDHDFDVWSVLADRDIRGLVEEGEILLRKFNKDAESIVSQSTRRIKILNYDVKACNCPGHYASTIGAILSKNEPFAATYYDTYESRNFSLRSDENYKDSVDVSVIAALFGGGGHKHSAGFTVPRFNQLAMV